MIIKTGNKKEKEKELDMNVKKGKIERTKTYKVLGNWINEEGNLKDQIQEIEKRSWSMINEAGRIARDELLGVMSTEAALLIYTFFYIRTKYIRTSEAEKLRTFLGFTNLKLSIFQEILAKIPGNCQK